jgi:hypothetical protein|tara:strand:+ start:84 stop:218 length:135 start_codon:yes stop_codon:yes gene_type:complete
MPVFSVIDRGTPVVISGQGIDIGGSMIIPLYMKIRPEFTFRVVF